MRNPHGIRTAGIALVAGKQKKFYITDEAENVLRKLDTGEQSSFICRAIVAYSDRRLTEMVARFEALEARVQKLEEGLSHVQKADKGKSSSKRV